jgi:hypothetical protein
LAGGERDSVTMFARIPEQQFAQWPGLSRRSTWRRDDARMSGTRPGMTE